MACCTTQIKFLYCNTLPKNWKPAPKPCLLLFAAYARLALGQQEEAARLLNTYVAEAPYNPNHYALLCEALSNAGVCLAVYDLPGMGGTGTRL